MFIHCIPKELTQRIAIFIPLHLIAETFINLFYHDFTYESRQTILCTKGIKWKVLHQSPASCKVEVIRKGATWQIFKGDFHARPDSGSYTNAHKDHSTL